jgi:hypothetical protein
VPSVNWFTFSRPLPALNAGQGTKLAEGPAMPRMPDWLTEDLLIIVFTLAIVGTGLYIAP